MCIRRLLAVFVLAEALCAGEFWVDGRTGRDLSSHGSAQRPWKTLGYALGQLPAPGAGGHVLHLVGGQTYGPNTNGEAFPIRLPPGVAIAGDGAGPVLAIPATATAIELAPLAVYDHRSRLQDLTFTGGQRALYLPAGARHVLVVADCRFLGQAAVSAYVTVNRGAVAEVGFRRCSFAGSRAGIVAETLEHTRQARLGLVVEDCGFVDLREHGVHLLIDSTEHSLVDARLSTCRFERVGWGVYLYGVQSGLSTQVDLQVLGCAFRACGTGVGANAYRGLEAAITVADCSLLGGRGQDGIAVAMAEGRYRATLRHNYVRGCRSGCSLGGGMNIPGKPLATAVIVSEGNLVEACGTGFGGWFYNCDVDWRSQGDRALGNDTGFGIWKQSPGAVRIGAAILARNGHGLVVDTGLDVQGGGLTVADNTGHGLSFVAGGAGSAFESCVFSDNGTEVVGTVPVSYSILKNMSYAGTGNQRVDPLLVRPHYKIAAGSPGRDRGRNALQLPAIDYEGDPRLGWPDVGADEYAAHGGARPYGVAGFGALGMRPTIHSPNLAVAVGKDLYVDLREARDRQGRPAAGAALLVGAREADPAFDLAAIGAPASLLWLDLAGLLPVIPVSAGGAATVTVRVPAVQQLVGAVATAQWLVLKADANPAGCVATDALRLTIGNPL